MTAQKELPSRVRVIIIGGGIIGCSIAYHLAKYSHELYASIEKETEQATGYRCIGSLSVARTSERLNPPQDKGP